MLIEYPQIVDAIMAVNGIKATLCKNNPQRARCLNIDLAPAIMLLIPQSVEWLLYVCPYFEMEAQTDTSVTLTCANPRMESRDRLVTSTIAWYVMHLALANIDTKASEYSKEIAGLYAQALNRISPADAKIPPRIPFWY